MNTDNRLLWIDLETTGLHPINDHILAVGLEITDARAEHKLFSGEWVVQPEEVRWEERMSDYVRAMHTKSGLLDQAKATHLDLPYVFERMAAAIKAHAPDKKKNYFAGSTLHFDLAFFDRAGFGRHGFANYRILDVSGFKVLRDLGHAVFKMRVPPDDEGKKSHTPLDDIHASQLTYRQAVLES